VQGRLVKDMPSAHGGGKAQTAAFKELNVSIVDGTGHLRNQNDVFTQAIDKLGKMKNPTEANALAMTLFGKSALALNPLIKAGGAELSEYAKQAENSGAVMSEASVNGLAKFKDGISAGVRFVTDGIAKFTPMVTKILTGLIKTLVQAIPTILPALTTGVVQIITAFVTILQQHGPMLMTAAINAVITLVKGLLQALPQIIQAAVKMVVAPADAITKQLPTLIPIAIKAIITMVGGLLITYLY